MPTFQRKTLRQSLGLDWIHDTLVGNTTTSWGSVHIIDVAQANAEFSGEGLHHRAWAKFYQSTNISGVVYRLGSFNAPSGAFIGALPFATTTASGGQYEIHDRVSPADKDRALDDTIKRVRVRQLAALDTVEGAYYYTLGAAGSPHALLDAKRDILDVFYYHDPTGSLDKDKLQLEWWGVRTTATGAELWIRPALKASQQLILDAILAPSLGAGDTATVNVPDDRWVLAGAAMKCYDFLLRDAPGQEVEEYRRLRKEAAREFSRLSARFAPQLDRKTMFDDPVE